MADSSVILQEFLEAPLQTATHKTILLWVKKLGYYALTKPKPTAKDWIILLDHSIQLGPSKLFVIWGLRASTIAFDRPLRYQDLDPLWMGARPHWTGELIGELLERVQMRLGHIQYAVGDYGSDIRKGLRLAEIPHIHDVTHRVALILKALYADDPVYQDVSRQFSRIRRQFQQTAAAHLLPPKQRTKSRYHNLRPIARYGRRLLAYLDTPPQPAERAFREAVAEMGQYREFFEEIEDVTNLVCEVERHMKHHGLSSETAAHCATLLAGASTSKGRCFAFDMAVYFQAMLALTKTTSAIVCTSDILESAFGKYKNYVSYNPMAGITDLALCLAAFTCSLATEDILEACERTRVQDVTRWTALFLEPSLLKKRREAFSESSKLGECF